MLLGLAVFSERKKQNEADSILEFEKLKAQVFKLSLSTVFLYWGCVSDNPEIMQLLSHSSLLTPPAPGGMGRRTEEYNSQGLR